MAPQQMTISCLVWHDVQQFPVSKSWELAQGLLVSTRVRSQLLLGRVEVKVMGIGVNVR